MSWKDNQTVYINTVTSKLEYKRQKLAPDLIANSYKLCRIILKCLVFKVYHYLINFRVKGLNGEQNIWHSYIYIYITCTYRRLRWKGSTEWIIWAKWICNRLVCVCTLKWIWNKHMAYYNHTQTQNYTMHKTTHKIQSVFRTVERKQPTPTAN